MNQPYTLRIEQCMRHSVAFACVSRSARPLIAQMILSRSPLMSSWGPSTPRHQRHVPKRSLHAARLQPAVIGSKDEEIARSEAAQQLLQILAVSRAQLDVSARSLRPGAGLALVAERYFPPGSILLTVPMSVVLVTEDGSQLQGGVDNSTPWSSTMALQILEVLAEGSSINSTQQQLQQQQHHRLAGDKVSSASSQLDHADQSKQEDEAIHSEQLEIRRHWANALPPYVPLPWAHCEDAFQTVGSLGDEAMALEAAAVQDIMVASQLQVTGVTATAWRRAWSLAHSRSFRDDDRHFVVPGVDLANHSFQPSASVRVVWDPDNCQGVSASRDICDESNSLPSAEPRIELFANEDGLREGQEVTINYGPWPSDVWALFYGFVPTPNPHDRVMLFADISHLADFAVEQFGPSGADAGQLGHYLTSSLGGDYQRLFMTAEGFDQRLAMAAQKLVALDAPLRLTWPAHRMAPIGTPPDRLLQPADILAARVAQLTMQQETSISYWQSGGKYGNNRPLTEGMQAAAECVAQRQRLLNSALEQLWGSSAVPSGPSD